MAEVNKSVRGLPDFFGQFQGGQVNLDFSRILFPSADISHFLAPPEWSRVTFVENVAPFDYTRNFIVPNNEMWLVSSLSISFGRAGVGTDDTRFWLGHRQNVNSEMYPIGNQIGQATYNNSGIRDRTMQCAYFAKPLVCGPGQCIGAKLYVAAIDAGTGTLPFTIAIQKQKIQV